jgi:hypothetical protein
MNIHDVSGNYPDKELRPEAMVSLTHFLELVASSISGQRHNHQWAVIGVDYPKHTGMPQHPRIQMQPDVTYVLLKCHCGDPKSVTLEGHWSMTALMQKIGEEVASSATRRTEADIEKDNQPSGEYPPAGTDG